MSGLNLGDSKNSEGDPADFLLTNAKYHDCHLTVGNPTIGQERIGVSSSQLIAHSSVFRHMLAESQLADPSGANTHIKDVSPATFKLMLRHVYGGKLPKMTPEEAADLALCADKYSIQRLVGKAAKHLKPTSAEDVFTALTCAAYINCPDLELKVSKIVQEKTDTICQNPKFLQLDENSLLFMVKQSTLNIGELQLWSNIIRWGEDQVKAHPQKTLRDCLNMILQHVRLLSLTSNEIVEHVLPKKVLTPEEFMDLTLAVSRKQTLQSPGLFKVQEKRGVYKNEANEKDISNKDGEKQVPTFYSRKVYLSHLYGYTLNQLESKTRSTLTIKPLRNIGIDTLTVKSIKSNQNNELPFHLVSFACNVDIYKSSKGHFINVKTVTLHATAVPSEKIVLDIKKSNGQSLILEANDTYNFVFLIKPPLPVHSIHCNSNNSDATKWLFNSDNKDFQIKFEDSFHILEIGYSV